jgi:chromosome segregation ATPase
MGEVRQLRMIIEKSAPVISRMSMVLMRFPRQDDKVERLSRELQDFRSQIAGNTSAKEALLASMREMETQPVPADPAQRNDLEMRKKMLAAQLQQFAANEQQLREQELELSSRLQKEQAILADLTEQLNAIDRKLQLFQ